jgi:hypothetical protein
MRRQAKNSLVALTKKRMTKKILQMSRRNQEMKIW